MIPFKLISKKKKFVTDLNLNAEDNGYDYNVVENG